MHLFSPRIQLNELQSNEVRDYKVYDHIEADFWFRKCVGEKSQGFILALIRLVMFQNSLVLAQFVFYSWQVIINFTKLIILLSIQTMIELS